MLVGFELKNKSQNRRRVQLYDVIACRFHKPIGNWQWYDINQ